MNFVSNSAFKIGSVVTGFCQEDRQVTFLEYSLKIIKISEQLHSRCDMPGNEDGLS